MRDFLKEGTVLELSRKYDGSRPERYRIISVTGEGSSAVCYDAVCEDTGKTGKLKEFYPLGYHLCRYEENDWHLTAGAGVIRNFEKICEQYVEPYRQINSVMGDNQILKNYIQDSTVLYSVPLEDMPSTVYIWTVGFAGDKLSDYFGSLLQEPQKNADKKLYDIVKAVQTVTSGISALHCAGLMHLDIKPDNFLIHYDGMGNCNPNNISMFDIDTFYFFEQRVPKGLGTPGYRAPELSVGSADHQSDIYSIGALLLSAVVGKEDFAKCIDNGYDKEFIDNIFVHSKLIKELTYPNSRAVTGKIADIIHKCLSPNKKGRYSCCSKLKADIDKALKMYEKGSSGTSSKIKRECIDPTAVIQKLLYNYPLYTCLTYDKTDMDILVIGDNDFSRLFVDNALQAAQMNDRSLNIRIVCENADTGRADYLKFRPELSRFVDVDGSAKGDNRVYGKITFEEFPLDFIKGEDEKNITLAKDIIKTIPDYVFVSLENTSVSKAAAKAVNTVLKNTRRPVCYVSETKSKAVNEKKTGIIPVYVYEDVTAVSISPKLDEMAFNTDRIWSGHLSKDLKDEFADFIKNKYNYHSSISFVLSIKYKLFSIGIIMKGELQNEADFMQAGCHFAENEDDMAGLFNELIIKQKHNDKNAEKLFFRLVNIEHKRWVLEKVTDGWCGIIGKNHSRMLRSLVNGSSLRGKVYDKEKRIHHCIAFSTEDTPLNSDEYRKNNRQKWNEYPIDPKLDELDRISVEIHQELTGIVVSKGVTLPPSVDSIHKLILNCGQDVEYAFYQFELCLKNISNGVMSYVKHYKRFKDRLLAEITDDAAKTQVKYYMGITDEFYFPFLEAYSFRNYKNFDIDLVENIPFILTHRFCKSLAMAFNDGRYDNYRNEVCFGNVASPAVLYPRELHYFYECDEKSVPDEVSKKLDAVINFMSKRNMLCDVHFTVLCPQTYDVGKKTEEKLNALKEKKALQSSKTVLKTVELYSREAPEHYVSEYCREHEIALFDMSSAVFRSNIRNAEFVHQILQADIPYFEFEYKSKTFTVSKNCEYLAYIHDNSCITINDMFSLMNALDRQKGLPEFADDYKKLWKIYSGELTNSGETPDMKFQHGVTNWTRLCNILSGYFIDVRIKRAVVFDVGLNEEIEKFTYHLSSLGITDVQKTVEELIKYRVLDPRSKVRLTTSDEGIAELFACRSFRQALDTIFKKWDIVREKIIIEDKFNLQSNKVEVYPDTLSVVELSLPSGDDKNGSYSQKLLRSLEQNGIIKDISFSVKDGKSTASFSFYAPRMKRLMTSAGSILEIYVYYEALKTGYFDDIRMDYEFSWYGGKVANEIDLVLTKGFKSIIVECKAVEKLDMNYYHKLYSIAHQFGIGVKTAIVNNEYRQNYPSNNALQIERGNQLQIKTFRGQKDLADIGILLKEYMENN